MTSRLNRGELNIGRFTIPYCIFGNGAKVIIAINGAQQSCVSWFPVAKYFALNGGFSFVCFDLPGQGRAKINNGLKETTIDEQINIINAVSERFSPDMPFYMISASWGTVIAAIYAGRFPGKVAKKILLSFALKPNKLLMETVIKGRELEEAGQTRELAELFIDAFGLKLADAKKNSMIDQFLSLPEEHFKQLHNQSIYIENYECLNLETHLRNIRAETITINGEDDPISEGAEYACSIIPFAEYISIPGAGHFLHYENPEIISLYFDFFSEKYKENKFYRYKRNSIAA